MGKAISASTVKLTWTHPGGSVANYTITYFIVNQPSVKNLTIVIMDPDALNRIVENLSPNTTYQFTIRAADEFGASLPSNSVNLTTLSQHSKYRSI